MQEEIWKDIPGYEGIYQVSDQGRVRSLERVVVKSDGRSQLVRACVIKTPANKQGYLLCGLWKAKERVNYHVHQLVAMAFLNHIPCGHTVVVDHINNIKTDNRLANLQLISPRYNVSKDLRKGKSKFVGVNWHKWSKKWVARIIINGKSNSLGYFHDEIEAAEAYQKALSKLNEPHGFH